MLSIARLLSVEHAMNYYEQDNYYAKEDDRGFTEWVGLASEELGLSGKVKLDEFNKLLRGHSLIGEKLVRGKDKEQKISYEMYFKFKSSFPKLMENSKIENESKDKIISITNEFTSSNKKISSELMAKYEKKLYSIVNKSEVLTIDEKQAFKKSLSKEISVYKKSVSRRPAYDLTFSAPKSVSLLALVDGNQELIKAHREAVRFALNVVEKEYTRVTSINAENNKRVHENSGKISAAIFEHDVSRKLDPQLHSHAVIMNMTKHHDEWRALNSDGFFYNSKKIGAVYQNELARRVKDLGYDIKLNQNGTFDIVGYSEEQLQAFSKRSEQLKELGAQTQKEATKLVMVERDKKLKDEDAFKIEELKSKWKDECKKLDILHPKKRNRVGLDVHEKVEIEKVIGDSVNALTQNEIGFKKGTLEAHVLSKVLGSYTYEKTIEHVDNYLKKHTRRVGEEHRSEYITNYSIDIEEKTIDMMKRGKDIFESVVSKKEVENITAAIHAKSIADGHNGINLGQKQAIEVLLTSNDRVFCWQGVAGAGKTFSLYSATRIMIEKGYTIKALAPSSDAAQNLAKEAKLPNACTVASLLVGTTEIDRASGKELWVVDEAGLLSAQDAYNLIKKAEMENARILFVGDTKQLSAVGAGNPLKQLQEHGMRTAHLTQGMRQKDLSMKEAVNLISAQKYKEGLDILEKNRKIFEQDKDHIISSMAFDYLSLGQNERKKSLFISSTNYEKEEITNIIRSELKSRNELSESMTIKNYSSRDMNEFNLRYSGVYNVGDLLVLNKRAQGLKANFPYKVVEINNVKNAIVVFDGKKEKEIKLGKLKCNLFEENTIDICLGDRLKWTKNHSVKKNIDLNSSNEDVNKEKIEKQERRINGNYFVIKSIDQKNMTAVIAYENEKGEILKSENINLKDTHYMDYSYVTTVFSSQGRTCEKVYASLSYVDRENFYVAVSRAEFDCKIYTHDKNDLYKKVVISGANDTAYEKIYSARAMEKNREEFELESRLKNNDKTLTESQLEAIKIDRKIREKSFQVIYGLSLEPQGKELSEITKTNERNYEIICKEINHEVNAHLGVKKDFYRSKLGIDVLKNVYDKKVSEFSKETQDEFYKWMNNLKKYPIKQEEPEKIYTEFERKLLALNLKVKEFSEEVMQKLSIAPEKDDLKQISKFGNDNQEIISKMFYYRINGVFGIVTKDRAAEGRKQLTEEELVKAYALVPSLAVSIAEDVSKKLKLEKEKLQTTFETQKIVQPHVIVHTQQQTQKIKPRRL